MSAMFAWRFEALGTAQTFFRSAWGGMCPKASGRAPEARRFFTAGERIVTAECSFAVEDIDAVASAVTANGGSIVIPKVLIPTVGHLLFFRDPEGNVMGAAQYDPSFDEMSDHAPLRDGLPRRGRLSLADSVKQTFREYERRVECGRLRRIGAVLCG